MTGVVTRNTNGTVTPQNTHPICETKQTKEKDKRKHKNKIKLKKYEMKIVWPRG